MSYTQRQLRKGHDTPVSYRKPVDRQADVTTTATSRSNAPVWIIEKGHWVCPVCHRRTRVGKGCATRSWMLGTEEFYRGPEAYLMTKKPTACLSPTNMKRRELHKLEERIGQLEVHIHKTCSIPSLTDDQIKNMTEAQLDRATGKRLVWLEKNREKERMTKDAASKLRAGRPGETVWVRGTVHRRS